MIPAIVERHAEDASFLWEHRERAARAPHFRLAHLAELDDRLEAHLDALRIAGEGGARALDAQLSFRGPGEVFASGELAFEGADAERIATVLDLAASGPDLARATASALAWCGEDTVRAVSDSRLFAADSARLPRVAIAAHAVLRLDPGAPLVAALGDPAPELRSRALRAVGQLGRVDLLDVLLDHLDDDDDDCRFSAAWSAALLGSPRAIPPLRDIAEAGGRRAPAAAGLAVRCMNHAEAREWITALSTSREHGRTTMLAIGAFGDPGFVPWLLQAMSHASLARVAGEAFGMITGIDLAEEHLDGAQPRGAAPGPSDDPDDDDVEVDPDAPLAWPLVPVVHTYWERHRDELLHGTRYLMGKPVVPAFLSTVLARGTQRQRHAAALELALRDPGTVLYEVRAPGFRQPAP
jgi:uncharacterized protein (TIGR02270 family)